MNFYFIMPQMSPMDWFLLMVFFLFIYYLFLVIIYFLKKNYLNVVNNKINLENSFKLKWY
uniref:ATP synthase F0 subunit 8 n=1 Tax=Histeromerus sp. QL-2013 TaxID=1421637 RepID=A0A0A6ZLL5_9HYME|nr:ATP synthase F0 subunit 8 [Histeromerus sp. QL-2013]